APNPLCAPSRRVRRRAPHATHHAWLRDRRRPRGPPARAAPAVSARQGRLSRVGVRPRRLARRASVAPVESTQRRCYPRLAMPSDKLAWLIGLAILCAAVSACSSKPDPATAQKAKDACVQACQARLQNKEDLSKGPCLSDGMSGGLVAPGFVCDVAHSP